MKTENINLQTPADPDIVFITNVKPLKLIWKPREDITAYELALCMPYLIVQQNIMPNMIDKKLTHFRHFKIIDPNE